MRRFWKWKSWLPSTLRPSRSWREVLFYSGAKASTQVSQPRHYADRRIVGISFLHQSQGMKNKILLTTVSIFFMLHSAFAQGSLTPPGAPAPTMKTLTQLDAKLDPRTPISSAPFTIAQSGSYYLTTNLTTVSNAIVITANGVTLDLNGFTIASTVANAANGGTAILLAGTATAGLKDITIFNGHIQGGVTNNGSNVYGGSGFVCGIFGIGLPPVNVLVAKVSVSGCSTYGIYLFTSGTTVVEDCTARTIGGTGIVASTVKSCVAMDCAGIAIQGDQVSDCRGEATGSGGNGLSANVSALNSYGYSSSGTGLTASNAQNCSGSSSTGTGLTASNVAVGCRGNSNSGTGLSAFIANSCRGTGSPGLSVTHNVNSF